MYTPNRNLINRLAKKSIFAIGDSCWHCHSGIGSFALQIAQKFKIKLLIWGESIAENSGKASFKDQNLNLIEIILQKFLQNYLQVRYLAEALQKKKLI